MPTDRQHLLLGHQIMFRRVIAVFFENREHRKDLFEIALDLLFWLRVGTESEVIFNRQWAKT